MKLNKYSGALFNTRGALGVKPAGKAKKNRVAEDGNQGRKNKTPGHLAALDELKKVWG